MSRVIFLDVDGVINIPRGMDRKLLTHLKGVVEDTGAKIVLSSDWRNAKDTRDEIRRILRLFDMDYVACTPPSKSPFQARRPEDRGCICKRFPFFVLCGLFLRFFGHYFFLRTT
eukprot:TRINITY_DN14652_c0_g1_i2.p1 TRINITY_DN14652_c0_g1~~TRINITY_DN14652_c0_g1_i2.p1  ORF type:complete len:114 (+),score=8.51 TRINITY_DN14652_c0_g1_i2:81-422(+)